MKVVLSVDPIKFPLTGIGRYTFELAHGLQQAGLQGLRFLHGTRLQTTLSLPDDALRSPKASRWKAYAQKSRLVVAAYRIANPWLKRRALRGLNDHVFHGPNYYLPPFGGRSVVTIHDLSVYLWPQCHPPERVCYMCAEIETSLSRATVLITDTEYTRQEVAKYFSWPLLRVHAVHLAAAPEFRPRSCDQVQACLQPLGLRHGGYILFVGTVEPRKNLATLLDAFGRLDKTLRQRWPLVVAGYAGWNSAAVHERLQQGQTEGWLRYLGYVAHDDLPLLMAGARLFVYPSLYEGFGLPVLEAMASGVPVICSNAASLPEVAANAAAMHEPLDTEALSELLQRGLLDDDWADELRAAGLKRAGAFSWARCCSETIEAYRHAAAL